MSDQLGLLERLVVAVEALAAKPPIVIMTAPAAGGGQSLTPGQNIPAAAPDTATTVTPAATGKGKGKPLAAAAAAKLAEEHKKIDDEAAAKAEALAKMPPLPGKPVTEAAEATTVPDDITMKQAVVDLLSSNKRPQAVKILGEYGCTSALGVPAEHRVEALAKLKAAAAAK